MAATYRDSIGQQANGTTITVDPSTLTYSANDVLVLMVWGMATLGVPTGSDLTWTEEAADDEVDPFLATNTGRIYTAVADASITSFTISNGLNEQYGWSLTSISGADTSTPEDGAAATSAASGALAAPSVSPAGSDSLLLCGVYCMQASGPVTFTAPGSMTEREDASDYYSNTLATEALASSGPTGTRTFTSSGGTDDPFIALSIAIKSAAAGGTPPGPPSQLKVVALRPRITAPGIAR